MVTDGVSSKTLGKEMWILFQFLIWQLESEPSGTGGLNGEHNSKIPENVISQWDGNFPVLFSIGLGTGYQSSG